MSNLFPIQLDEFTYFLNVLNRKFYLQELVEVDFAITALSIKAAK